MSITTYPKPQFATIKAAIVLALDIKVNDGQAHWWNGTVARNGNSYVVLQVTPGLTDRARKTLEGYGLQVSATVEGSSYDLLPISVDQIENYLPKRVTRKWLADTAKPRDDDLDGPHIGWKREVTAQLDQLGITYLKMTYSGAGDSSNPDEFECTRAGHNIWYPKQWSDEEEAFWYKAQNYELPQDLQTLISEYVWETLCQYDCVNNDGGGGDLKIDLSADEPAFSFSCYTNEMTSTTHAEDEEV